MMSRGWDVPVYLPRRTRTACQTSKCRKCTCIVLVQVAIFFVCGVLFENHTRLLRGAVKVENFQAAAQQIRGGFEMVTRSTSDQVTPEEEEVSDPEEEVGLFNMQGGVEGVEEYNLRDPAAKALKNLLLERAQKRLNEDTIQQNEDSAQDAVPGVHVVLPDNDGSDNQNLVPAIQDMPNNFDAINEPFQSKGQLPAQADISDNEAAPNNLLPLHDSQEENKQDFSIEKFQDFNQVRVDDNNMNKLFEKSAFDNVPVESVQNLPTVEVQPVAPALVPQINAANQPMAQSLFGAEPLNINRVASNNEVPPQVYIPADNVAALPVGESPQEEPIARAEPSMVEEPQGLQPVENAQPMQIQQNVEPVAVAQPLPVQEETQQPVNPPEVVQAEPEPAAEPEEKPVDPQAMTFVWLKAFEDSAKPNVVDCLSGVPIREYNPNTPVTYFQSERNADDVVENAAFRAASFAKIHREKIWLGGAAADEAFRDIQSSGLGSTITTSLTIRNVLNTVVEEIKKLTGKPVIKMLDIGCGDMVWMHQFLMARDDVEFTGVDIVPELTEHHRMQYAAFKKWRFVTTDILNIDVNERFDLIISRHLTAHLTNRDTMQALEKFSNSQGTFLLATTFPREEVNSDLQLTNPAVMHMRVRPQNLEIGPYRLSPPICMHEDTRLQRAFIGLWKLPLTQIVDCKSNYNEMYGLYSCV